MKTKIVKKPVPFYAPKLSKRISPARRLAALARLNSLSAYDIVTKAQANEFKVWRSMLKSIGLDHTMSLAAAHRADEINKSATRKIQQRLKQHNDRVEARRLASSGLDPADECYVAIAENREEEPAQERTEDARKQPSKQASKQTVFGHPATAVIRWMGKRGYTLDEIRKIASRLDLSLADVTLRIQIKAGQRGERGGPAKLTQAQKAELRKLRREVASAN